MTKLWVRKSKYIMKIKKFSMKRLRVLRLMTNSIKCVTPKRTPRGHKQHRQHFCSALIIRPLSTMVWDGCERDKRSVMFLSSFCGWHVRHNIHSIMAYISLQRTLKSRNTHKTFMNKHILRTLQVNYRLAYNCDSLQYKSHMHFSKTAVKRRAYECVTGLSAQETDLIDLFLHFCSLFLFQIPLR